MSGRIHNSLKKIPNRSGHWHIYILRCSDNTLYTGIARDLSLRIIQHNAGEGAKYTRGRRPVTLVYQEMADDYSSALRREHQIKKLGTKKKRQMIAGRSED